MRSTGKVLFTLEQQQITGLLQVLASNGSASSIQLLAAISGQFTAAKSVGSTGTQKTLSVAHLWHESHSRSCGEMATCSEMHTNKPRCWGQLRSSSGSSGQELAHCNGSGAHEKRLLPSPTSCNEQQGNAKTRRLARRAAERAVAISKAAARIQLVVRRFIVFWRAIRHAVAQSPKNRGLNATEIWREEQAERLAEQKAEAEQASADRLAAAEKVLASSRARRESEMLARAWRLQIFVVQDHRGRKMLTNHYVNSVTGEKAHREPEQLRDLRRRDEVMNKLHKYQKGDLSDANVKRLCQELLGPYGPPDSVLNTVLTTNE
mmetsp:Transcript_61101/g.101624  ORF Transcript_61101/g.101624 Transcript_61101/m.101624 type:complete len:320 (+) Transcript_61101:3-962(+)